MPFDPGYDDDEPKEVVGEDAGKGRRFGDGDEIRCFYCGQEYRVFVSDAGRLKLRAI